MTHSPPVPPGNQSPYPLQEPPHDTSSAAPTDVATTPTDKQDGSGVSGAALGIGLAIGLGSAALLAAWFFSGSEKAKPQRAAARKPRAKTTGASRRTKSSGRGSSGRSTATRRRRTTTDKS